VRFLDVAEVQSIDAASLVGDDRRFRVAEKSPRGAAEEWVVLYVGCASAGTQTAKLVLDQELAN
jgi:hypothetical protein